MHCLFCQIANKTIPANFTYEDEHVVAFPDIHPQAPIHQLIIPRKHLATLNDTTEADQFLLGHMLFTATQLAKNLKLADDGYRVVLNCNKNGGQAVFHIHAHLLGGRIMTWPPG